MNFKLSQTQKDYFDVIRTYGSILSIITFAAGIIIYAFDKTILERFFKEHKIWAVAIGSGLVALPFIILFVTKWINIIILKKRKLSNIIIEKQEVIIDITNKGKKASYYERLCFYRLGKDNKNQYVTKLNVSGKIDSKNIYTSNCFYNLNNDKNRITISYVNNAKKLNQYSSIVKENGKFLVYSAILKNTFLEEEESWDLYPINYCMFYNMQISFPKGKRIAYAKLYKKVGQDLLEIEDINPVITTENNRAKLILQLVDYDYGDFLSLRWKLI